MIFESKLSYINEHIFSLMSSLSTEYNAINLSQGFPNFAPDIDLQNLVAKNLNIKTNQYSPMPGILALREKIAEKILSTHNIIVDAEEEVTITVGATEAIYDTITAFVWPDDEVILIEPCYDCYRPAIDLAGGKAVIYKMTAPNFEINWDDIGSLITSNTRMICLNTPNNPTGSILSKDDMHQLLELVKETNILIMCDEVYEHMVFDGKEHVSPLCYPELRERTISVFSFGKTYHITGWKVGYSIAPPSLTKELRKVHQNTVFDVCHPMQSAIAEYMERTNTHSELTKFYEQKRDLFLEATSKSQLIPLRCSGSYFQLFDYSALSNENDFDFCVKLIKKYGVAAIPISRLYSDFHDDKIIRFCFAKTDDLLIQAGKRLEKL